MPFAFYHANAQRSGIDPRRIGVADGSAGGHLAELVVTANESAGLEGTGGWPTVSSRVKTASAYYGVSDFTVGASSLVGGVVYRRSTQHAQLLWFAVASKKTSGAFQLMAISLSEKAV